MGVCCSAGLGVFKFVVEYVDYWWCYQVLCSFVVKMPRPHGNCKFRNEWLAIDKFKDWVARDRADDKSRQGGEMYTVAVFTLCVYENGANRKRRKTCHGKPCVIGSTPKM